MAVELEAAKTPMQIGQKARILVVDDHPLVREGLAQLINTQPDLVCCGAAANLHEAEKAVAGYKPELVVLDLRLGEEDGHQLIGRLKARFPEVAVLVFSQLEEGLHAGRMLEAGARGYVMKQRATDEVLHAMRTVLQGQTYLSPEAAFMALRRTIPVSTAKPDGPLAALTEREFLVFKSLAAGKVIRQIASELGLSQKTIETYRERIKLKLGLPDAPALSDFITDWLTSQASGPESNFLPPGPAPATSPARPTLDG